MATAVREIEYTHLSQDLTGLEGYEALLVLLRLHGHPVGQARLPVIHDRVSRFDLVQKVLAENGWSFWRRWLDTSMGLETPDDTSLASATVAICTRERPQDLQKCLEGLGNMIFSGDEILVIDSCSRSDDTRLVVQGFAESRKDLNVRYVREERPGLDRARNRALREARGEVVAFIDDDAVPDSGWLLKIVQAFSLPSVLCVTGLTMPSELETPAQEWFERYSSFNRGFERVLFDKSRLNPLSVSRVGAGVNMAVRRSVLELVGPFDEDLDAGTPARSGGDNEMFSRILRRGYAIVYQPEALNWHRHRHTWPELRKALFGYGVGTYATWARLLLRDGEITVLGLALGWFWYNQLPKLLRALLRRPGAPPLELCLDELRGCLVGPWAYIFSTSQGRR